MCVISSHRLERTLVTQPTVPDQEINILAHSREILTQIPRRYNPGCYALVMSQTDDQG